MKISASFDSGNIEVVQARSPGDVQLKIRPDAGENHMQWFHFRVSGVRDTDLRLRIINASAASYPKAWLGYRAVASHDREHWYRVDTQFDGTTLEINHRPTTSVVWYAYFAPYAWERHLALIGRCQQTPEVTVESLGDTVDGHDLDLVTVGTGPRILWIIARQHPGESMAEWFDGRHAGAAPGPSMKADGTGPHPSPAAPRLLRRARI